MSTNLHTLLLDMDCTIADLYPLLVKRHNEMFGTKADPVKYLQYFGDHIILPKGIEIGFTRERIDAIFRKGHFFKDILPIRGAKAAVERMSKYFDIYVVTNPYVNASYPYKDKLEWLQEHFPSLAKKLIATPCKHLVYGDILVDDHMPFCDRWQNRWLTVVASLDYPWIDNNIVSIKAKNWFDLSNQIINYFY